MAAGDPITDLSDLINLSSGGNSGSPEQINFYKDQLIAGAAPGTLVAGRLTSLWRYQGNPGATATVPTTYAATTNATDGSLKQTSSASGRKKRLSAIVAVASVAGSLVVYDRLGHSAGNDGTVTTAQSTNVVTSALTRYTSGVGVEIWADVWAQIGGSSTTITASYTNTTPTSGRTTQATAIGNTGFREQDRLIVLPLQVGDRGVTAAASVTLAATTGTAGSFGVTLAYPLVVLPLPLAGAGRLWSGFNSPGGPLDLGANSAACLAMAWFPNTATAPQIFGQAFFVEK